MAYFIGVDLHKTQFTVHVRTADFCEERSHIKQYPTNTAGYDEFLDLIRVFKETDSDILVAIESTGNARYFRDFFFSMGSGSVLTIWERTVGTLP